MSYHSNAQEIPEYIKKYRQYVASLDIPNQEMDALINIVHSILSYFVDQAFNVQTDQITLQSTAKMIFIAPIDHVKIENNPENSTADARTDGVESAFNQRGASEP